MKDQNKLIIGIVALIVVAYFLFFKQKEGFTIAKRTLPPRGIRRTSRRTKYAPTTFAPTTFAPTTTSSTI